MNYRLHAIAVLLVAGGAVGAGGCVQRTMAIRSEPSGAAVWVNSRYVGQTPVERLDFTHYGEYEITMRREGYRTRTAVEKVAPPWYERFPADLIAESLVPWTASDAREFEYVLERSTLRPAKDVVADALKARERLGIRPAGAEGEPERQERGRGE